MTQEIEIIDEVVVDAVVEDAGTMVLYQPDDEDRDSDAIEVYTAVLELDHPRALATAAPWLDLDHDPETSLTTSLRLHMMSEHGIIDLLLMDERDVAAVHLRLHRDAEHEHDLDDLRFRAGRAFRALLIEQERQTSLHRLLVPPPRIRN